MSPSPLLPPRGGDQHRSAGIRSHSFGARSVLGQRDLNTQSDRAAGTVSAHPCIDVNLVTAYNPRSYQACDPDYDFLVLICVTKDIQAQGIIVSAPACLALDHGW